MSPNTQSETPITKGVRADGTPMEAGSLITPFSPRNNFGRGFIANSFHEDGSSEDEISSLDRLTEGPAVPGPGPPKLFQNFVPRNSPELGAFDSSPQNDCKNRKSQNLNSNIQKSSHHRCNTKNKLAWKSSLPIAKLEKSSPVKCIAKNKQQQQVRKPKSHFSPGKDGNDCQRQACPLRRTLSSSDTKMDDDNL